MGSIPSLEEKPVFWLSSQELTAWARPRAVYALGLVTTPGGDTLALARTEPPSPSGEQVLLRPRYEGDDDLSPAPERPIIVNVYSAPAGLRPGESPPASSLTLAGVGEIYSSEAEAAADDIRPAAARGA